MESVIERTVILAESPTVQIGNLSTELISVNSAVKLDSPQSHQLPLGGRVGGSMKEIVRQATASSIERDLIAAALQETEGTVTQAANHLGISRKGLQNKMKDLVLRNTPENPDES